MCEVGKELGREICLICKGVVIFGLPYEITLEEVAIPLLESCGHVTSVSQIDGIFSVSFREKE